MSSLALCFNALYQLNELFSLEIHSIQIIYKCIQFILILYIIMNLTTFVAELAAKTGLSKKAAKEVLSVVFQLIINTVKKGSEVRVQGFGTFKANQRKAREGVNPQKPSQKIKIPAMKVVSFRAGADFKKAVKGK